MDKARLIDATALYARVSGMGLSNGSALGHHSGVADIIAEMIQNAPTIDPKDLRPVSHWIPVDPESDVDWECARCGCIISTSWDGVEDFNFCPCCGARMEG